MSGRFEGKAAVVTGSSSGIGKATALLLAREGACVCGAANRNTEGGEATRRQAEEAGAAAVFVQADVGQAADCQRVVDAALGAFGRIDVLVNNAGITRGAPLERLDEAFWDHVVDTNLKSAYLMTRAVAPDMLSRGAGAVVNVSSVHAVATVPRLAVYAASKAGLCGLTRGLAVELGPRGIRVNCILPGTIDTTLYHRSRGDADPATWQPHRSDAQVLGRCGSPDEIASAIAFLASGEASFVNGATLTADGGLLSLLKDR